MIVNAQSLETEAMVIFKGTTRIIPESMFAHIACESRWQTTETLMKLVDAKNVQASGSATAADGKLH